MEISRRWFLCGSLATVAAVYIPTIVKATKIIYKQPFKAKRILEMNVAFPDAGLLNMTIGDRNMHSIALGRGGLYRWVCGDLMHSWYILDKEVLNYDFKPFGSKRIGESKEPVRIYMITQNHDGFEWGKKMYESHTIFDNITQIDVPIPLEL